MDTAGLPSRLQGRLERGRAAARARMTSRATIRRRTGAMTDSPVTGLEIPEWQVVHTDLPMCLAGATQGPAPHRVTDRAGVEVTRSARHGNFPHDTTDLLDNDYAEITSGDNTGLVLRIAEVDWQDQATALRVPVVVEDRPEEWP